MTDVRAASSVRNNVAANLASRIVSALITLACMPIYIRVLGIGGYGLIGVWMTLETLANLVDLGLSPTMTREMALLSAPDAQREQTRDLVRTLEVIYWPLAFLIGGAVVVGAPLISTHWIRSAELSPAETRAAVTMIGILIACRWPLSFYTGGLVGLERQVMLAWVATGASCVTNLGAVTVLLWFSPTVTAFFVWQICANLTQTVLYTFLLWSCMPSGVVPRINFVLLLRIARFAGGTTGIAILAMVLTDLDKLVVSKRFSLEVFGYYTLAWRIAGVLSLASLPLLRALFPALCRWATDDRKKLADLYHGGCQLISVLTMPAAAVVVLFGRQMVFAWTGNAFLAARVYPIVALLAAGSTLNCLMTVPFALQLAYGWTALALYTNLAAIFVAVPLLLAFTSWFGPTGAAAVWVLVNFSYLVIYIPMTHRHLLKGEQRKWYLTDAGQPLVACATVGLLVFLLVPMPQDRLPIAFFITITFGLLTVSAAVAAPQVRTLSPPNLAKLDDAGTATLMRFAWTLTRPSGARLSRPNH
jgi:O-antigen/teichoic acid export membrane protein